MQSSQHLLKQQQQRQQPPYHPHPFESTLFPSATSTPPSPPLSSIHNSSAASAAASHPILHFQSLFASMEIYSQKHPSTPSLPSSSTTLSLIQEESNPSQTKNKTEETGEYPSHTPMDDIHIDSMQPSDSHLLYSQFASDPEKAAYLEDLSSGLPDLPSISLDEYPTCTQNLLDDTLLSSPDTLDPTMMICTGSPSTQDQRSSTPPHASSTTESKSCIGASVPSLPFIASYPHAMAAKLLSSRNINNSAELLLDPGIAGAAEGDSPPPWLWEAYRRASVAAVDSLLKEQRNQQRLLMEQQRQIEQMRLRMIQERITYQEDGVTSGTDAELHDPQFHHQIQKPGVPFQQDRCPSLFLSVTPESSSTSLLEQLNDGTIIASPSPSSAVPSLPTAGRQLTRGESSFFRPRGMHRRASQGAHTTGSSKGSAMMARSKSAVNSPTSGSSFQASYKGQHALDSASPRTLHRALFKNISLIDMNQDMKSGLKPSSGISAADSSMEMSGDTASVVSDLSLATYLTPEQSFEHDQCESPTGSNSSHSFSPSPSASPALSPTLSNINRSSTSSSPASCKQLSSSTTLTGQYSDILVQDSTSSLLSSPVACPVSNCNKTFARPFSMNAHLRTHDSPKPFACHLCERVFSRKHDLQRHIRVHTGSKPYICLNLMCQKAFARTDALCRHYKVEEQCRQVVIQMQMLESESREHERPVKNQASSSSGSTSTGHGNGAVEVKETRGHGTLRKWQQFMIRQLVQQDSAQLGKGNIQILQPLNQQRQQQHQQLQQQHLQQQLQQQQRQHLEPQHAYHAQHSQHSPQSDQQQQQNQQQWQL